MKEIPQTSGMSTQMRKWIRMVWNEVIKIWFVKFKSETQWLVDSGSCDLWKGKIFKLFFFCSSQFDDQSFQCKHIYKTRMINESRVEREWTLMFIGKTYG